MDSNNYLVEYPMCSNCEKKEGYCETMEDGVPCAVRKRIYLEGAKKMYMEMYTAFFRLWDRYPMSSALRQLGRLYLKLDPSEEKLWIKKPSKTK